MHVYTSQNLHARVRRQNIKFRLFSNKSGIPKVWKVRRESRLELYTSTHTLGQKNCSASRGQVFVIVDMSLACFSPVRATITFQLSLSPGNARVSNSPTLRVCRVRCERKNLGAAPSVSLCTFPDRRREQRLCVIHSTHGGGEIEKIFAPFLFIQCTVGCRRVSKRTRW